MAESEAFVQQSSVQNIHFSLESGASTQWTKRKRE